MAHRSIARAGKKMGRVALFLNLLLWPLLAQAAPAPCKLAILGDSLTAGYGVSENDAWPIKLGAALEHEGFACKVIDAGVSGDTSAGGLSRLSWVLADKPSHLIVELGGNDGLRALPVAEMKRNLEQIIQQAQAAGIHVFLAGIVAPPNLGQQYTDSFKAVFPDLVKRFDVPLYPFLLDGVILNPELMQADRIHPNARGVDEMVRRITPSLAEWLQATGVARTAH